MRAFVVLGLVFFHTKPRDWGMSPKWPILCWARRQSINLAKIIMCVFSSLLVTKLDGNLTVWYSHCFCY